MRFCHDVGSGRVSLEHVINLFICILIVFKRWTIAIEVLGRWH